MVTGTEFVSRCERQFHFQVNVQDPPVLELEADVSSVCSYMEVRLSVHADPPGPYVYEWWPDQGMTGADGPTPTVVPEKDTWYHVRVSTSDDCMVVVDSIFVEVRPADVLRFTAFPSYTAVCPGDEVQLGLDVVRVDVRDDMDGPLGSLWQNVQGGAFNTDCGSMSGNALHFNGSVVRWAETVDMDVGQGGVLRFALVFGSGAAPCEDADIGDDVLLEYSTNGGVGWTPMSTYYEWAYPVWTVVEVDIPPPAQSTSTRFRWRQLGTFAVGTDNWALDDVVVGVNADGGMSYTWSPQNGLDDPFSSSPVLVVNGSGWYRVEAVDSLTQCVYTDSVWIEAPLPYSISLDISGGQACSALGSVLSVTHDVPDGSVVWEPAQYLDGADTETPVVLLDSTMWYVVTVEGAGDCPIRDSILVEVPFSTIQLEQERSICEGDTILLDAGVIDATYLWSTGEQGPAVVVMLPGVYTVLVTEPSGCQVEVIIDVDVAPLPVFDLGGDRQACDNEPVILSTGAVAGQVLWSTGDTGVSITVDAMGMYWARITDINGCSSTDSAFVGLLPAPQVSLQDTVVCAGTEVLLDVTWAGARYLWNTGDTMSSMRAGDTTRFYSVVVTDPWGCTDTASAMVEAVPMPDADLGGDRSICSGERIFLSLGTVDADVLWSTGESTGEIAVGTPGPVWVRVSRGPCLTGDTIMLEVNDIPEGLSVHELAVCFDDPPHEVRVEGGSAADRHLWSTGDSNSAILVSDYGWYFVTITTEQGCAIEDSILVWEDCPPRLFVPNTFTPDGNDINDVFRPVGTHVWDLVMEIYDRWGELIHVSYDDEAAWDGTYRGMSAQDGVYVWRIAYSAWSYKPEGRWVRHERMGHVTLLR